MALFSLLSGEVTAGPLDTLSPRQVVQRFDSLVDAGADQKAKSLCTGTALRMFSFLAEAQHKFDPFLDTARSHDTVIEEKREGRWCGLKIISDAVFSKPLMGMNNIHSVQAVHLFRQFDGWKLAEFEELPDEKTVMVLHNGIPTDVDTTSPGPLFPVSHQAPEQRGASRMQLRISRRNHDFLPVLPQGPGQRVLKRGKDWALVETSLPTISAQADTGKPDSLRAYLGSGSYLDLSDSLLLARAFELRKGTVNDAEIAGNIYRYVSSNFQFKLGAALFNDSRESLRSLKGDCSEAAVLTAALLRAAGIPSAVAMGFATTGRGVFIGHAWAEAFLEGRWIGVDAALREFPAGAQRIMLLRLSGSEDMLVAASNLMLQSLSNLDIEITEAWAGSKPLPLIEQNGNAEEGKAFFEEVLKRIGE